MVGPCTDYQSKWFLDADTGFCKEFRYGGCLGNDNNFQSETECRNFCWDYLSEGAKSVSNITKATNVATTTLAGKHWV